MKKLIFVLFLSGFVFCQAQQTIEIGTFNIEWFPCKDDGKMMKKYGIDLRYPPQGEATDVEALFSMLKELDIELLGVQEIVDAELFARNAAKYLGGEYHFIYSPSGGSQKVGFLYNSNILELVGQPETYDEVLLKPDSRLRPAFRAYFKTKPDGFDFHAIVTHLKASPRGWDLREQQWQIIAKILADLPELSGDADIILLGDMNNVTNMREKEFTPLMSNLKFYWATSEIDSLPTNYWQPDWKVERIQGSAIDHIFVSDDAKIEYLENSAKVGGMCAKNLPEYKDEMIPEFYSKISDHCPVYASFRADKDND